MNRITPKIFLFIVKFSLIIILTNCQAKSQILRVDSVSVDSVWVSDSSWHDNQGILQQRISRDCRLSFIPQGIGTAQVSIALSIDSAKNWANLPNQIAIFINAFSSTFPLGQKSTIEVRILGGDRVGTAFKVISRQYQPIILGDPKLVVFGSNSSYNAGATAQISLKCKTNNQLAHSFIEKIWWDAYGDGSWDDSTSELYTTWNTIVPLGAPGQRRAMVVKARDSNGLWSAPETLTIQFGIADKPAIVGDPKLLMVDSLSLLATGSTTTINLKCKLIGGSPVSEVWWDALGDGQWDDSSTALNWAWTTIVPDGTFSQRCKTVMVKARGYNNYWSAAETLTVQFGMQRKIIMKNIPAGTFSMGEIGLATPIHQVTLSAFKIQETEVTQEQYLAVMGTNPAYFKGDLTRPVEWVNWYSAALFCNALSKLSNLDTVYDTTNWQSDFSKNGYRLPTEAQWEYACRAGSNYSYWWGADTIGMGNREWWDANSAGTTHPVASKLSNVWGLFDMGGNVREWVNDWEGNYSSSPQTNPTGASNSSYRIFRGGDWRNEGTDLRSAYRDFYRPSGDATLIMGFRVVLP